MERLSPIDIQGSLEKFVESSSLVTKARNLAAEAHKNQKRDEGTPYFTHCEAVARIVYEELQINDPHIIAALYLHDVPEDTNITLDSIKSEFGEDVAFIVDGMTKIKLSVREDGTLLTKAERDRLTEKKAFLDPIVAVCKGCGDRLHNMRTLQFVTEEKRISKAKETLIYAKLLESLGIWVKMIELEDLSLKYLDPEAFEKFTNIVENDARTQPLFVENMTSSLSSLIPAEIKSEVSYKINGLTRLKHKLERTPDVKDVNDLISFRVVVDEDDEDTAAKKCYQILRIFQEKLSDMEDQGRFDNFYFTPRINGYSAIQITLNSPNGAVEIGITSKKKEEFNNWGVVSLIREGERNLSRYSQVMVFTPKGKAKFLPQGSTLIDFAYSISPSLGASAINANVDGKEREMTHVLQSGQTVDIRFKDLRIAPPQEWTTNPKYCKPTTMATINEQLLNQKRYEQIEKGKSLSREVTKKRGIYDLIDVYSFDNYKDKLTKMLFHLGCKGSLDNLYFQIGSGYISSSKLDDQLNSFGLCREKMNLRTLIIEGVDRRGVLESVGEKIKLSEGNIGALNQKRHTVDGKVMFNLRLVIENINDKSVNDLLKKIKSEDFVTNIDFF